MPILGLPIIAGTLNDPACYPSTPQELINDALGKAQVQVTALTGIIISATAPAAIDRDKAWVKLDGSGNAVGVFTWSVQYGQWLYPHLYAPSSSVRVMWVGTLAELALFDSGSVGAGVYAGPMWEEDTDFAGRLPIGVGAITGTAPPLTTTNPGEILGSGGHTLTIGELPTHSHSIIRDGVDLVSADSPYVCAGQNKGTHTNGTTEPVGSSTPFNIVPPVRSLYIIKRTSRQFYLG